MTLPPPLKSLIFVLVLLLVPFASAFSPSFEDAGKVNLDKGISMYPVDADAVSKVSNVKPLSDKDTLTYDAILPDTKIKYTVSKYKVKEEIVFSKKPDYDSLIFKIELGGKNWKKTDKGVFVWDEESAGTFLAPFVANTGQVLDYSFTGDYLVIDLRQIDWTKVEYPFVIDPTYESVQSQVEAYIDFNRDSGNNFNDTKLNASVRVTNNASNNWLSGRMGNALNLNGTQLLNFTFGGKPTFHNSQDFHFYKYDGSIFNNDYTVNFWIKSSESSSNSKYVFYSQGTGTWSFDTAGRMYVSNGIDPDVVDITLTNRNALFDGNWHMVSLVWDGRSTGNIYVDGVLNATETDANGIGGAYYNSVATRFSFGGTALNANFANITLDTTFLAWRALSADELVWLYNFGNGRELFSGATFEINSSRIVTSDGLTPALFISNLSGYCNGSFYNNSVYESVSYDYKVWRNNVSILNATVGTFTSALESNIINISSSYSSVNDSFILGCRVRSNSGLTSLWINSSILKIENILIDNCSVATARALNFTAYDENNLTSLSLASVVGTVSLTGYNFTTNYQNVNKFSVCIYPAWLNVTASAYYQYRAAETERYYLNNINLNNQTKLVNLYNFNSSDDNRYDLEETTFNYYYSYYPGLIGKLQRFYPASNSWITVQVDKSDTNGKLLYYIYLNSVDYRIIWEDTGGSELYRTDPIKFICADGVTPCQDSNIIPRVSESSSYSGMSWTPSYNNETGIYSLSWTDTNNLVSSVTLLVQQEGADRVTTICNTTTQSSSGTIVCNVSGYYGTITVRGIRTASPPNLYFLDTILKPLDQLYQVLDTVGRTNDGIFLASMLQISFVGFGAMLGGAGCVLAGILGIIVIYLLHLATFVNITLAVGITTLGAVVMFIVKR